MARAFAEIAFTSAVRTVQTTQGSADGYATFLTDEADRADRLNDKEIDFIVARDGFYQATTSEDGWPYVQFRGGPQGFVKILNDRTIAYADFRGNRQYLSVGNLNDNNRVSLILVDYPNRRRLKVWGRAQLVDVIDNPELVASLHVDGYRALPERAIIITIEAYDWNCPQHIPQRLTLAEFEPQLTPLNEEIARLTAENESLKNLLETNGSKRAL